MHRKGLVSIWFFIGALLLIYGLIIVVSDLVMERPNTVMADLRPGLWWGGFLVVVGAIYSVIFRPGQD